MTRSLLAFLFVGLALAPASARQQAAESCECEAQRPATLAVVNGVEIPTAQVESDVAPYVAPLREQMRQVREQGLQQLITSRLLELEAARRGVSYTKLIQAEVVAKADEPTEADVRAFYERNRAGLEGKSFEETREALTQYIRSQRQQVQMTILTTDLRTAAKIEVHEYSPAPPATEADRARTIATVNGSAVTLGELEDSLRAALHPYRLQIYQLERDALDARIDDILIEHEARRRNVAPQALVDSEVRPRARKVDAFDASKFYNENKAQFGGRAFAEVKDDLVRLLELREFVTAKRAYAEGLRKTAAVKVSLVEPAPPTYAIRTDGRPSLGSASAPVTLVVFSDFECPKCAVAHHLLDELVREYAGKVRLVARNYPLEQHQNAYKAALAAEAAFEQGKYWEYARLLFANQKSLSVDRLKELASEAGLDRAKFDAALDSGSHAAAVDADLEEGHRAGVLGTPAVYVNGRAVYADTREAFKAAIDAALRQGA